MVGAAASGFSTRDYGSLTLKTDQGKEIGSVLVLEDVLRGIKQYAALQTATSGGRKSSGYRG